MSDRATSPDGAPSDGVVPTDGTLHDATSTKDTPFESSAADALDVGSDAIDGVTLDVVGGDTDVTSPPPPSDAPNDTASPDGGTDGDASSAADALDAPGDLTEDIDSAHDTGDTGIVDSPTDSLDAPADAGDGGGSSGFPGSTLVDTAQGAMINGWVGTPTQLWTRCYSTALHQKSGQTFHTNCDFKGPSVSIARVSYMGNVRVIGGYNSTSWFSPTTASYGSNTGCFLFSVTNSFKHDYPGSSTVPYYIYNNQYYGPTFGAGNDWYVHSQMTFGTCRPGYTYQCRVGAVDSAECNMDFCGTTTASDYYTLEELEVWVK